MVVPTKQQRKGLNSLIILTAWEIWKHHNKGVFNGTTPNARLVMRSVEEEGVLWCAARAKELRCLLNADRIA